MTIHSTFCASEQTEKLGYYGEKVVLWATEMGLGTCWVGGSFDRKSCPFELKNDEMVVCTITIGTVTEEAGKRERFVRNMIHRKTKTIEEMFNANAPVPNWFLEGMKAVQKVLSAINRQPVMFTYKNGKVTAFVENSSDVGAAIDLGIAKLHFEIGAGGGTWEFGNGASFKKL